MAVQSDMGLPSARVPPHGARAGAHRIASTTLVRAIRTPRGRIGACLAGLVLLIAALGPVVAQHSPTALVGPALSPPSSQFPLGTDTLGRDVLSRVLFGGWELI